MARLPVYTSQGGINTSTPGNIRSPEESSRGWRSTSIAAQQIMALSEQWQRAKDAAENLDGKNKLVQGITDILTEGEDYNEYKTPQDLSKKEAELAGRMNTLVKDITNGFSNNLNAQEFAGQAQLSILANQEKLKGIFRDKTIDMAKSNLLISQQYNMENFISTGNEGFKTSYLNDIDNMEKSGLIDRTTATGLRQKTDYWNVYNVYREAETNPEAVISKLEAGKYNIKPEYYHEVLQNVNTIKTNKQLFDEYKNAVEQDKFESQTLNVIYGDESYDNKLKYIDEQEFLGNISGGFAAKARRYIKRYKPGKENSLSDAQTIADILQSARDLAKETDNKNVLLGSRNLRQTVLKMHSDGLITTKDAVGLNKQIDTITSSRISEATEAISYSKGWEDAVDYIKDTLPPELQAEAIRNTFYEISGRVGDFKDDTTRSEFYKKYAMSAVQAIQNKNRQRALNTQKTVQKRQGETVELTQFVDSKLPQIQKQIGVKLTVTDRYAKRSYTSEHTQGKAFDVSMSEHTQGSREKIVKALLDDSDIQFVSTSDPTLLKKYKSVYGSKLRDFTSDDKKLGTNHKNHIHVTVNTAGGLQNASGTVRMRIPNGKIVLVPQNMVSEAEKNGGVRI